MNTEKCSFGKLFLSKGFVGVVIVLSLLFLVVLPTIAAEDDFVLGVYGNANEDDTIDMRDLTYVKRIFFGEKPDTEFADAKYDGELNPLDFVQIKLIIVGKETELTLVDSADRIVTVEEPITRVVLFAATGSAEAIRVLNVQDRVVGVPEHVKEAEIFFPYLSTLPSVGKWNAPDYEEMIELNQDIVIVGSFRCTENVEKLTPAGIPVVALDCDNQETMTEEMLKAGYIFDTVEEAEEFIEFYEGCVDTIADKTEKLSEADKPRVYYEYSDFLTVNENTADHSLIVTAGGINIAAEKLGSGTYSNYPTLDPEWVIVENPDIIAKVDSKAAQGYEVDDPTEMKAVRENVMNRSGFDHICAVENEQVYVVSTELTHGHLTHFVHLAYLAKWFHPELFEDLDPEAIHQEYLTDFQGLDYDLDEHGVFAYPPIECGGDLAGIPDN